MKTRKSLYPICLALLLLGLLEVSVWAGKSKSKPAAPEGWPARVGKWKLYPSQYGFVYAGSKSSVAKMDRIVRTVIKELEKENVKPGTKGLILVMGKKEKPPFEVEKLLTMTVRERSKTKEGEDAQKGHEIARRRQKEDGRVGIGYEPDPIHEAPTD